MAKSKLKKAHEALNNSDPFSYHDRDEFNKKDLSMIRNIQILNKINKDEAIDVLRQYKKSPKNVLKKLASDYKKKEGLLGKNYPKNKPEVRGKVKHEKRVSKRAKQVFQKNRKDVKTYVNNPKNKTQKNYPKISKASKKYIDASEYELRYGVNSKKSQAYRVKIGLSQKYEGRVIK